MENFGLCHDAALDRSLWRLRSMANAVSVAGVRVLASYTAATHIAKLYAQKSH